VTTGQASARGDIFALEGTVFEGRFEVERRIAEGGFAVVYKAFQVALDRWVALKVLKAPRTPDEAARAEFRDKFAIEAKTIAKLRHPNIVDVYDFSVATLASGDPAPWMALEWLDGETLARRLRRRREAGERGLAPPEALALLRPALEALAHAHRSGIVHRDVKPANIMVPEKAGGALKVLDFGIAKIVAADELPSSGHTRTESMPAFSPAYAAPEQVAFSRTGPWTDVHGLGLVLGEVLTDQPPFADDGEAHVFEQAMSRDRPTPARKGRDVGAFEPVLAKALALSPRDRWRNAGELLAALDDALAGRGMVVAEVAPPTDAPDAAAVERPRRRRRALAVGVAVAAAGLAAGGVWLARGGRTAPRAPAAAAPPAASTATPAPPSTPEAPPAPAVPPPTAAAIASRPAHAVSRHKKKEPAPAPVSDGRDLFDDTK
jgi:serine/threonine-protein kinase